MNWTGMIPGLMVFLFFLSGCGKTGRPESPEVSVAADSAILLTPDQVQTLKMVPVRIRHMAIPETVFANGYVDVPPQNQARISPMISGYITAIDYLEGQRVNRGSEVIRLKSKEAIDLQEKYLDLKSRLLYHENEYNRQKTLNDDNVNAGKVFVQSEAEYRGTQASLEATRRKLELTGIRIDRLDKGYIETEISIPSPFAGYVTGLNVMIGQFVNPDEVLFEVTDPGHLHVELSVFEKDAGRVRAGQKFKIRINPMDQVMDGEIFLVNKKLDDEKRTLNVHGDFDHAEGILPGMFAQAEIITDSRPGWVLPSNAIFKGEKENFIFAMRETENQTELIPVVVHTGREFDEFTEITSGMGTAEMDTTVQYAMNGLYYLSSMLPE